MLNDRKIKLGLSMRYFGYHVAAWRHPDARADGAVHFDYFLKSAIKAEAAKLDMIFFADGLGIRASAEPAGSLCRDMRNVELEPLTLLAALGVCTRHIGLVATASTTYDEPLHVARKFASIDHISGGRAGWNVVTSWSGRKPGISARLLRWWTICSTGSKAEPPTALIFVRQRCRRELTILPSW
jgi:hypothetical protein